MSFTFEDMKEKIKRGINYGNALECFYDSTYDCPIVCKVDHDVVDDAGVSHPFKINITHYKNDSAEPGVATFWSIEEMWNNPETTDEIINFYKQLGYTAIRLPVNMTWHHEFGSRETDARYINYVRSVIDKIVNAGLFCCVVLFCEAFKTRSISNAVTCYRDPENNENVKLIVQHWDELASALSDIPEDKLAFELLNEFSLGALDDITESCQIIAKIYESCIDSIRKTGGFNENRLIGIGGYRGDAMLTYEKLDIFSYLVEDEKVYFSFAMYLAPKTTFCYYDSNKELIKDAISEMYFYEEAAIFKYFADNYRIIVSEYGSAYMYCKDNLKNPDELEKYRMICLRLTATEVLMQQKYEIPSYFWDNGSLIDRTNLTIASELYYNIANGFIDENDKPAIYQHFEKGDE